MACVPLGSSGGRCWWRHRALPTQRRCSGKKLCNKSNYRGASGEIHRRHMRFPGTLTFLVFPLKVELLPGGSSTDSQLLWSRKPLTQCRYVLCAYLRRSGAVTGLTRQLTGIWIWTAAVGRRMRGCRERNTAHFTGLLPLFGLLIGIQ